MITYNDRVNEVRLGDRVETRVWFRRHQGRVVYIPGVTPFNRAMERDGLRWVGVRLDEGGFLSVVVDPKDHYLLTRLKFLGRDTDNVERLDPNVDPEGGDSFGAPF